MTKAKKLLQGYQPRLPLSGASGQSNFGFRYSDFAFIQ
jgi:hypothetical protein